MNRYILIICGATILQLAASGCRHRKASPAINPEPLIIQAAPQAQDAGSAVITSVSQEEMEFQATGHGNASKYERLVDAQLRADQDALAAAVNKAGVDIFSGYSDMLAQDDKTDTQTIARYLLSMSAAAVAWERTAPPVCGLGPAGSTECTVNIKGRIHQRGKSDPAFTIQISNDFKPLYKNAEQVSFGVRTSQQCYLYILTVDETQNTYMLYPNAAITNNLVKPGQLVAFPDRQSGITLNAVIPDGRDNVPEILHLIATKQPLLSWDDMKEDSVGPFKVLSAGAMPLLMEKLGALDRSQWTMRVLPYQIVR